MTGEKSDEKDLVWQKLLECLFQKSDEKDLVWQKLLEAKKYRSYNP